MEPSNYHDYSDHRPDLTLLLEALRALELKVFDPIGAAASDVGQRGAFVAFGNTRPASREVALGRQQRGGQSDGAFRPRTGGGFVSAIKGDYDRALRKGVRVDVLLVETFGALGPELMELLVEAAELRRNKLTSGEYDETTWSARTWLSFVKQRISVAVVRSCAREVASALGLTVAVDPRWEA